MAFILHVRESGTSTHTLLLLGFQRTFSPSTQSMDKGLQHCIRSSNTFLYLKAVLNFSKFSKRPPENFEFSPLGSSVHDTFHVVLANILQHRRIFGPLCMLPSPTNQKLLLISEDMEYISLVSHIIFCYRDCVHVMYIFEWRSTGVNKHVLEFRRRIITWLRKIIKHIA